MTGFIDAKAAHLVADNGVLELTQARTFAVRSGDGKPYLVVVDQLGTTCTCPAGANRLPCSHAKAAQLVADRPAEVAAGAIA